VKLTTRCKGCSSRLEKLTLGYGSVVPAGRERSVLMIPISSLTNISLIGLYERVLGYVSNRANRAFYMEADWHTRRACVIGM